MGLGASSATVHSAKLWGLRILTARSHRHATLLGVVAGWVCHAYIEEIDILRGEHCCGTCTSHGWHCGWTGGGCRR